ncbi:MAG: hypothetical protein LBS72_05615 [Oscillospiraceae bacterium]|jgi:hypothetical protein|nr:hypothetical protein [Oscillospiraceae bacterium]
MISDQSYLENDYKVYIDVNENRLKDGRLIPVSFVWEDGVCYNVDKVIDVRPGVSTKAGGMGLRYTVRVGNRQTNMFLEEDGNADRWFMERKHL